MNLVLLIPNNPQNHFTTSTNALYLLLSVESFFNIRIIYCTQRCHFKVSVKVCLVEIPHLFSY